jgi:hypothetical protein
MMTGVHAQDALGEQRADHHGRQRDHDPDAEQQELMVKKPIAERGTAF